MTPTPEGIDPEDIDFAEFERRLNRRKDTGQADYSEAWREALDLVLEACNVLDAETESLDVTLILLAEVYTAAITHQFSETRDHR